MSPVRHGFVASVLGLTMIWTSGCGHAPNDDSPTASTSAEQRTPIWESVRSDSTNAENTDSGEHDATRADNVQQAVVDQQVTQKVLLATDQNPNSSSDSQKSAKAAPKSATAPKSAAGDKPLFTGWSKPAATLVLSGEQHGYIEPCGCAEHQSGGFARRHDLVKQLQSKGWPLTSLDVGGTVNRSRAQSKFKFQAMLAAMKDMRYSVLNLGPEELKLGAADLLAFHQIDEKDPLGSLSFVSANVTLFGSPEIGTPQRSKVLTLGKIKVGVTSVIGASFRREVAPDGANVDITIDDPIAALPAVLKELEAQKPDLLVLLSHGTLSEGKSLAAKFPQFAAVLSTGGVEEPDFENPQKVGKTLFVQVGQKGKFTGVLGFFPDDKQDRLKFELVKLTPEAFQDSPKMVEHMRIYQDLLKDSQLAELEPPIKHSSGSKFVGSKVCGECHTKAFEVWEKSDHAHAYDSLIKGRPELKDRWVSRIYDPECLSCHVTGWHAQDVLRYASGFESKEKTPLMLHNGCENCHGPGSKHIELINADDYKAARNAIRLTLDEAKKNLCVTCHDSDNDPKFSSKTFDAKWEKIKHKGLD